VKTLQKKGLAAVWVALLALGAACSGSDGPTDPDGPTTGTIAVSAATTGDDQDNNGYSVMLDGTERAAIGTNGSVNLTAVSPGTRSVSLSEVSGNCAVGGEHPRSVSVTAGATTQAAFDVSCVVAVGSIEVTVATTGDGTDPDGYSLLTDGQPSGTIDANASRTVADVSIGSRAVELGDVAPNCSVSNDNPQTVNVPFGGTAAVSFDVQCDAPLTGTIALAGGGRRWGQWGLPVFSGWLEDPVPGRRRSLGSLGGEYGRHGSAPPDAELRGREVPQLVSGRFTYRLREAVYRSRMRCASV